MHFRKLLFILLAITLAGCGGGGGGSTSTPASPPAPTGPSISSLQGIWEGQLTSGSSSLAASAVVLADGQLWLLVTEANGSTRMVKGALLVNASSFSGSGKSYLLGLSTVNPVSLNASVTTKSNLSGNLITGSLSEAWSLNYLSRYDKAASLSDFAGHWTATLGPANVSWTIAAGGLTGSSSTGCSYIGQATLRPEAKALVDFSLTETCAGKAIALAGIATFNADGTRVILALTTADGSSAMLLALAH